VRTNGYAISAGARGAPYGRQGGKAAKWRCRSWGKSGKRLPLAARLPSDLFVSR